MITLTFDEVFTFENLYKAHIHGRVGKRSKKSVVRFEISMIDKIYSLYESLQNGKYKIDKYQTFSVYEPKTRQIQTLRYSDRVVQHVLCDNVLAPYFTKRAILDNCVCQKNKGTHFALKRFENMLKDFISHHGTNGYFLKCDVLKYFPSIPHDKLKQAFCSQILDKKLREYVAYVIDSFHTSPDFLKKYNIESCGEGEKTGRGIPIGNQSSQIFGMYYLDPVDRFIKEILRIKAYSRYMDDFIAIHGDLDFLKTALGKIKEKVAALGLTLNSKTQIFPLKNGVTYLGFRYRVTDDGKIIKTVKKQTKQRLRSRTKLLKKAYIEGYIDSDKIINSLSAFHGHLCHGNNVKFENELNKKLIPVIAKDGVVIRRKKK